MSNITITKTSAPKEKPQGGNLPFGTHFTDHMFLMNYVKGEGWINPRVVPYAPLQLEPSSMVFHYAQEIFEGMKAYRTESGEVQMFRPLENIRRMNMSGERLSIPEIPEDLFLEALETLVDLDRDWVPSEPDTSLYIRPFAIATDPYVGVRASNTYIFAIICCPVGCYYPEGLNPVKIKIENEDVRAVRGGTGYTKCGGNYAASIRSGERAAAEGFSQVLWLDGIERKYIEEVGSMNVMFKIDGKVVTPALNGSVLPGITRKSCIEVLKSWEIEVEERDVSLEELINAIKDGKLEEAFGTGTAAVISPIGEISYDGDSYTISEGKIGEITGKLYDTIAGIQWGKTEDTFGYIHKVPERQ